jgi:hypothetical protein
MAAVQHAAALLNFTGGMKIAAIRGIAAIAVIGARVTPKSSLTLFLGVFGG